LNDLCIKHPAATFFLKVEGNSMNGAGIFSGDIVIADYSLTAKSGDVVIACLDGECTIKRLRYIRGHAYLEAAHPDYPPIQITPETQFEVWGVVTHTIHSFKGI
jgi:DNA polymerase V